MPTQLKASTVDLKVQKEQALKKVDQAYYNPDSIHYMDNERYRWAVEAINKKYDELSEELTINKDTDG